MNVKLVGITVLFIVALVITLIILGNQLEKECSNITKLHWFLGLTLGGTAVVSFYIGNSIGGAFC